MGAEEVEVDRRFEENKLLKSVRPFRLSLSSLLRRIFVTRVGLVWSVSAHGDAVCVLFGSSRLERHKIHTNAIQQIDALLIE